MEGADLHCSKGDWLVGICKHGNLGSYKPLLNNRAQAEACEDKGNYFGWCEWSHDTSHNKDTTHKMWTTLTGLYWSTNENRKMVLQVKLNNICMNKYEIETSYLTRIQ